MDRWGRACGVALALLFAHGIAAAIDLPSAQALMKKSGQWTQLEAVPANLHQGLMDPAARSRDGSPRMRDAIVRSRSVESTVENASDMSVALMRGMRGEAGEQGFSDDLRAKLDARRPQLQALQGVLLAANARVYRELSDVELRRYADFLATPAAAAYIDASQHGTSIAYAAGSAGAGCCVAETKKP